MTRIGIFGSDDFLFCMLRLNQSFDPSNSEVTITFVGKLAERYKEDFDSFFSAYEIVHLLVDDKRFTQNLKPKKERVCRFCGKDKSETSFSNKAHLISELLGNKSVFTDAECDKCNHDLGVFENDLANYIGAARAFAPKHGKNGFPKFKNPDGNLIIREGLMNEGDEEKKIIFESIGLENDNFSLDHDEKILRIHALRHPYVPSRVYKALLKMALLALPDDEVNDYEQAIAELKSDVDRTGSNLLLTNIWVNPGPPFPSPLAYLCKKKEEASAMLSHTFILYFQNYIYQIFLPAYEKDLWMYNSKQQITFQGAPPLIDERWAEAHGYPTFHRVDLSSNKIVRGDKQVITLTFDSTHKLDSGEAI